MAKSRNVPSLQERNNVIFHMLRVRRNLKVSELQELLGVSDMTVRRCLNEMANEGLIKRVHGGAVAIEEWEREDPFSSRISKNLEVKIALAKKAVDMISDGGSIYLDGGTTCYEIAKQLAYSGKKCVVITESIAALRELRSIPGIKCILLGGELAEDGNSVDGHLAAENAARFTVDLCIFSTGGFDDEQLELQELTSIPTKKVVFQRTSSIMCVADASKYKLSRCFRFCSWEEVDLFVTDSALPPQAKEAIAAKGVAVHVVDVKNTL